MARTVCRRAERIAVRFTEEEHGPVGKPSASSTRVNLHAPLQAVAYLNRLSDLIWLFGRLIEVRAGVDASLRDDSKPGPKFSRAW